MLFQGIYINIQCYFIYGVTMNTNQEKNGINEKGTDLTVKINTTDFVFGDFTGRVSSERMAIADLGGNY